LPENLYNMPVSDPAGQNFADRPDSTKFMSNPLFTADEIAAWSGGFWTEKPLSPLASITTDSRSVPTGSLFVALQGERFDAHDFVPAACQSGAGAVVVRQGYVWPPEAGAAPCMLVVSDTLRALQKLAAGYRRSVVAAKFVGITGSAGKTTVKEITAHLLAAAGATARTIGNFNNEIGLPLSLLRMQRETRFGVFEIGMNHPGEIAPLAALLAPDCGVITNVGPVHLEAFKDVAAIAAEKAELLRALPSGGLAFLDRDSPWFEYLASQAPCRVIDVSLEQDAGVRGMVRNELTGSFTVCERGQKAEVEITTGLAGRHNMTNALLAIAVARTFGVSWEGIKAALLSLPRPPMRWETSQLGGLHIINDAYNASPISMQAALETFADWPSEGRRVALLADMLELGADKEEKLHRETGRQAVASGVELLVLVGWRAGRWIAAGARAAGLDESRICVCADREEAAVRLGQLLLPGDTLLLKGSRSMALEEVLAGLRRQKNIFEKKLI